MARPELRTPEVIQQIQDMIAQGVKQKDIALKFNCSSSLISKICKENNINFSKLIRLKKGMLINGYEIIQREYDVPWKSHETAWKVKCTKCGAIEVVRKSTVETTAHDCNNERYGRGKTNVIAGMRFGLLTTTGKIRSYTSPGGTVSTYVEVQCDCGSEPFFVRKVHLEGKHHSRTISCGCASKSSGELKIAQILNNLNISYKEQYCIPELSAYMRFDFAIFKDNKLHCLIEYDGEQHYTPIERWGGEEKFIIQQERDNRKNQYCAENGLKLIRIPYYDFHKINEEYILSVIEN